MTTDYIKRACYVLFFIAALNIVTGVLSLLGVDIFRALGINWISIVYGLVVGIVGGVAYKTRSLIALGVGGAILITDMLLTVGVALAEGYTIPVGPTVIKITFAVMVLKPVIEDLRARRYRNF